VPFGARWDLIVDTSRTGLEPMTSEDLSGRTRLRGASICPSTEARDALLSCGTEDGMREGDERLDTVLKAL
jgi:hypothetical protein